jgi:hypothetical protein
LVVCGAFYIDLLSTGGSWGTLEGESHSTPLVSSAKVPLAMWMLRVSNLQLTLCLLSVRRSYSIVDMTLQDLLPAALVRFNRFSVVVIRGSQTMDDWLSNMNASPETFLGHRLHAGKLVFPAVCH